MNREMFKSATLMSLFVLCIVLTGQLMLSLSTDRQDSAIQALAINKTFDIKEIFSPQSFIISFGGGIYTQNYSEENSNLWREVQVELMVFLQNQDSLMSFESVDESRWIEMVKSRAVRFKMPFDMTLGDVQTMLGLEAERSNRPEKFNSILISTHDLNSLYFANEDTSEFYRMQGPELSEDFEGSISRIEKETDIEYRRVEDLFGLQDAIDDESVLENNSVFPIKSDFVDFVYVTPEVDVTNKDDSALKSYANKAFGKQFNFVKKMIDVDESVIYLYGYGNKALRLGKDGSIQYTERIEPGTRIESTTFVEAIQLALNFIDQYGGAPASMYLADYETNEDDDKNTVYTFHFDYRTSDFFVMSDSTSNNHSIVVEIVGNQVTNFDRLVHRYKSSFMVDIYPKTYTIIEVINLNGNRIQSDYLKKIPELEGLPDDQVWTRILGDISNVERVYFKEADKLYLSPAWKLDIRETSYTFGLYDGRLLRPQTN